ncbi:hypothetical protein COO58_17540 [Micromonospora sp. WMMA1996]|uniref:hypothetical protein n=1 Tax=Micromonospora sp. WMMA1996 TaxID=2039878 RepID=UPI000BF559AC|nr:hypothetical protein [Micromonospora sp. WMMA1996]PGH46013.1 hypothetical protein COO58_17540 [Micromonospora sp. WMMA1996]
MNVRAEKLRRAVLDMAARYGEATQEFAYAINDHADVRARHLQAIRRRYIALHRLTRALADLTGGTTR